MIASLGITPGVSNQLDVLPAELSFLVGDFTYVLFKLLSRAALLYFVQIIYDFREIKLLQKNRIISTIALSM